LNLNQLRFVRETVRQDFNLSAAAQVLFTSQPGVSKAIIELEEELGIQIFVRHGKRIKSLTEPGRAVLPIIERLLLEAENLKRVGSEFGAGDAGTLVIATTHTQARYSLPEVVKQFRTLYPHVRLSLLQGTPLQLAEMVRRGEADIAIATESIGDAEGLISVPCFQWQHALVLPADHPLLQLLGDDLESRSARLTIDALARYPIVTYHREFAGRSRIDVAFQQRGLSPDIVLEAIDADVIKTYVRAGLGVGIVAGIAIDADQADDLVSVGAGHLFGNNVTHLAVRRGSLLRGYVYRFITLFAPTLDRDLVERLFTAGASDSSYQL
jgi:LysR family cys regulon transcriptional activator